MPTESGYIVTLDKYRATWNYFTTNPAGGGFGSNYCGSKRIALGKAIQWIPAGQPVEIITKHAGIEVSRERITR